MTKQLKAKVCKFKDCNDVITIEGHKICHECWLKGRR